MEVILLEKMRNLGDLGEKVSVKSGYGRNFLIPQKKAVLATERTIELFEQQRADLEKKARQALAAAEQRAAKLNDMTLVLSVQASDEGKLYGSIGVNDIKEALAGRSIEVDKREIVMPDGVLHSLGEHVVNIHLHSDVVANLKLEVVQSK